MCNLVIVFQLFEISDKTGQNIFWGCPLMRKLKKDAVLFSTLHLGHWSTKILHKIVNLNSINNKDH